MTSAKLTSRADCVVVGDYIKLNGNPAPVMAVAIADDGEHVTISAIAAEGPCWTGAFDAQFMMPMASFAAADMPTYAARAERLEPGDRFEWEGELRTVRSVEPMADDCVMVRSTVDGQGNMTRRNLLGRRAYVRKLAAPAPDVEFEGL